ncbi:MAG: hypothetical protein GKR77_01435 [Legionellales bacterium]|nr:hypothetical protein [Legionellales bacterium]
MSKFVNYGWVLCLFLVGCQANQYKVGGTVLQYQPVEQKDYHPKKRTKTGAMAGAGTGAVVGVIGASAISVVTFGLAAPLFVPIVATTTTAGAGAGAGVGYAADKLTEGTQMYLYHVALIETDEVILAYHTTRTPREPGTQVIVHKVKKDWVVEDV